MDKGKRWYSRRFPCSNFRILCRQGLHLLGHHLQRFLGKLVVHLYVSHTLENYHRLILQGILIGSNQVKIARGLGVKSLSSPWRLGVNKHDGRGKWEFKCTLCTPKTNIVYPKPTLCIKIVCWFGSLRCTIVAHNVGDCCIFMIFVSFNWNAR